MKSKISFFVLSLICVSGIVSAQSLQKPKPLSWGVGVSGWKSSLDKFDIGNHVDTRGSSLELSVFLDRGSRGDVGFTASHLRFGSSEYTGGELYNYTPIFHTSMIQFGPTLAVGVGRYNSKVQAVGRAEATLSVRIVPALKLKAGVGYDYPRMQRIRVSANIVF